MTKSIVSVTRPESLGLENLSVLPNESNQQAYERIRKLFCEYIDVKGSAKLAEVVQGLAESEHGDVIISAYMSACVRLKCALKGVACELQIMMLPMIVRTTEFSSLPSEIDQLTAAEIQRVINQELSATPFCDTSFIPTNRLLTCNEFEGEQPQTLQEILQGVAQGINNSRKNLKHNFVSIPKNEEIGDVDDNLMYDGRTFITCRLMPFVVVQREDRPKITSLDSEIVLKKIARALEMSCEGYVEGDVAASDAQVIAPCIQVYELSNPFIADALIQSRIGMEKLYYDVSQFIEDAKKENSAARIMYAPKVGIVTIDITKTIDDGSRIEAEFSVPLKHSHASYSYVQSLEDNLETLGVGFVQSEILDGMDAALMMSKTLH